MPQPLSKMPKLGTIQYGADVCAERPQHMLEVMRIIAAAAFADHWVGTILIGLNPETGVKLAHKFNSLDNETKKAACFDGIAITSLTDEMHKLLSVVLKVYRTAVKARNPFAHSRFGCSSTDNNVILLIDSRVELLELATYNKLTAQHPQGGVRIPDWFKELDQASEAFNRGVMCYRLKELYSIREAIEEATRCLIMFSQISRSRTPSHIKKEILFTLKQRLDCITNISNNNDDDQI